MIAAAIPNVVASVKLTGSANKSLEKLSKYLSIAKLSKNLFKSNYYLIIDWKDLVQSIILEEMNLLTFFMILLLFNPEDVSVISAFQTDYKTLFFQAYL